MACPVWPSFACWSVPRGLLRGLGPFSSLPCHMSVSVPLRTWELTSGPRVAFVEVGSERCADAVRLPSRRHVAVRPEPDGPCCRTTGRFSGGLVTFALVFFAHSGPVCCPGLTLWFCRQCVVVSFLSPADRADVPVCSLLLPPEKASIHVTKKAARCVECSSANSVA